MIKTDKGVFKMKKLFSLALALLLIGATALPAFADDTVIKEVRLTVAEPAVGEAPDKTIVSEEPGKYTASVSYWLKRLYPGETVTTFEAGYDYGMVFEVTPAPGYTFEAVEKNKNDFNESPTVVYVNGQKTRCVAVETDKMLVRAFDVTVENKPEDQLGFFARIINAIKTYFANLIFVLRHLFPKV